MKTIKTNNYGTVMLREHNACGDVLLYTENIDNTTYNIYLGFCGCPYYYATVAE